MVDPFDTSIGIIQLDESQSQFDREGTHFMPILQSGWLRWKLGDVTVDRIVFASWAPKETVDRYRAAFPEAAITVRAVAGPK
jgi:hypothetical protein